MEEGRQIEAGSATEPSNKVVRLPRDWLGPREELVPLGESAAPPAEPDLAEFAPDDFWGERAAAIHSVVQAPEPEPPLAPLATEPRKRRLGRRRLAAAAFTGIAAAAALALLLGGSPSHVTRDARWNFAAIVSSGVSRILKLGPPEIVARATAPPTVKHVRHHSPHHKAAPRRAEHHSSPPPASTYVAHASSPPSPQPTYHPSVSTPTPRIVTTPHRASSRTSSGATVSPTGQNGALGPVQSPNG
ncbi:MAG TPA: hypothetical protein VFH80_22270 [Solirubrobacteraceae bacterium]|nr:hypothetical protein [Solirubrobacteraceae bacterium]